jgi:hypothetical protein
LLPGAILMTWLYTSTAGSVAAVAVWYALFDLFSGSPVADGVMNGLMSTVVALWAVASLCSRTGASDDPTTCRSPASYSYLNNRLPCDDAIAAARLRVVDRQQHCH